MPRWIYSACLKNDINWCTTSTAEMTLYLVDFQLKFLAEFLPFVSICQVYYRMVKGLFVGRETFDYSTPPTKTPFHLTLGAVCQAWGRVLWTYRQFWMEVPIL
ncbi:hypothetical protein CPB83DRAFT_225136 [Crepidotus variabilis]|uniref:Uncharacterized protein n=1 Tax=Crepidotus variabilis TaxID=179855 RepID=A0A9P6EUD6_9AGAR|nr:hypothetical protein CPB83DRAFT_225136 [Crepidotus variabilis]